MAFGFGFNKAKVLASAEKNVKAGKLSSAIADYEKIAKEDPRDLTVLNTIGDLHARLGNGELAATYFKRVADAYAADGFTVKAIAMYKKLTKVSPGSTETLTKLADLYIQQGLYNDARSQYMQVAEQHIRNADLQRAAAVFQKVLDLDPENSAMQTKLAELYVKLGKKPEARDIYVRNAELFRSRGVLPSADEALGKALAVDPTFSQGLLLRGSVKLELGDAAGCVSCLEKVADIDSRPEGLRTLLKAQIKLGNLEEAAPLARKLFNVFTDATGVHAYADAVSKMGEPELAIAMYTEFGDRLLSSDTDAVINAVQGCISPAKEKPAVLIQIIELLQRAGATTHVAEAKELLAHACVQGGDLERARELYHELATLEPQNPLHEQNYKQVLARLGLDVTTRVTAEQGAQALMVDELETPPPTIDLTYAPELEAQVKAAITDAELFESYNVPAKAIGPLENVLPRVPRDPQVNHRLASLYARTGQFAQAAERCRVLEQVYSEAAQHDQARNYRELAERYAAQAPTSAASSLAPVVEDAAADLDSSAFQFTPPALADDAEQSESEPTGTTAAFTFGDFEGERTQERFSASSTDDWQLEPTTDDPVEAESERAVPTHDPSAPSTFELNFDTLQQHSPATPAPAATVAEVDFSSEWEGMFSVEEPSVTDGPSDQAILEMVGAKPAADEAPALHVTEETVESATTATTTEISDIVEEVRFYIDQAMWSEASSAITRLQVLSPAQAAELRRQIPEVASSPAIASERATDSIEVIAEPEIHPQTADADDLLGAFDIAAAADAAHSTPKASQFGQTPVRPAASSAPATLDEFVLDLEESLGAGFSIGDPAKAPAPTTTGAGARHASTATASPVAVPTQPPTLEKVVSEPSSSEVDLANELAFEGGALDDIFAEFKNDMEAGAATSEDPETHYNLGVAFKEMGLLDEAIGELQKVCLAIDSGHSFPQVIQAYTWLADCFVQKGVPEAAVRWYEKALKIRGIDAPTATAIHYELACACEAAGQKPDALAHFMEVYGANIDYRDVAERIQALKS